MYGCNWSIGGSLAEKRRAVVYMVDTIPIFLTILLAQREFGREPGSTQKLKLFANVR